MCAELSKIKYRPDSNVTRLSYLVNMLFNYHIQCYHGFSVEEARKRVERVRETGFGDCVLQQPRERIAKFG